MRIDSGETLSNRGTIDSQAGDILVIDGYWPRTKLAAEPLSAEAIELTQLRVWDDLASLLPGVAANDDLAIIEGTWGTDAPTVQTSDAKSTSITQRLRFRRRLGAEYVSGGDIKLRIRAGMITTISDDTATVDVECYCDDEDGGVGADLCATAAQSINSLTKADRDFVITATGLAAGDVLDFRVTIAITDAATATAVIGEISRMVLLRDIRG